MARYFDVGPRTAKGSPLSPNVNGGNWQVSFTPTVIASQLTDLEIYHMVISGPAGSTFTVFRNSDQWGAAQNGFINEWDPQQPLPCRSGDTINFNWNTNANPQPAVTIWLRTQPDRS